MLRTLQIAFLLGSLCGALILSWASQTRSERISQTEPDLANYVDIAERCGLTAKTLIGGEKSKEFILESTGGGVALFDFDMDDWLDIFLVNGSRNEGFTPGNAPTNHLYRNNRDGTFTDVTEKAGLVHHGWGQGVCAADY